jgi:hypothetical protein
MDQKSWTFLTSLPTRGKKNHHDRPAQHEARQTSVCELAHYRSGYLIRLLSLFFRFAVRCLPPLGHHRVKVPARHLRQRTIRHRPPDFPKIRKGIRHGCPNVRHRQHLHQRSSLLSLVACMDQRPVRSNRLLSWVDASRHHVLFG